MNYKKIIDTAMPVTFDSVGEEDGHEVERMWLADFVDGKYVEDYVVIRRDEYDIGTDAEGAVFALVEGGRMLVKAPNVKYYRIPEDVYRIAPNAFRDCTALEEVDVPYTISEYELTAAMEGLENPPKAKLWFWSYHNERSKELEKEIAEGYMDEYGFVYSRDRKRLLRAADVGTYFIPEGVEQIDRLAFVGCIFEELHVPYTCKLDELPAEEYPVFGNECVQGCVMTWDRPYSQEDEIADTLYTTNDEKYRDEKGVVYTANRKRLLSAGDLFSESEYHVPEGVETICSHAFEFCNQFLTLSLPSSIKVFGDCLFGKEGGKIVIRHD